MCTFIHTYMHTNTYITGLGDNFSLNGLGENWDKMTLN